MRVVFTGGGTGGHLFPFIAIARALQSSTKQHRLSFIGPHGISDAALHDVNIAVHHISAGKIHRNASGRTMFEMLKVPIGILQAAWHLFWLMPDVVFSKGGYGAAPVLFVAWLYNIPIVLHDSDAVPGLVTQTFASRATAVLLSFAAAQKTIDHDAVGVVGHPVRLSLNSGDTEWAQSTWSLGRDRPVVLIIGGSQGAQPLNDLILEMLPRLIERADVLHITGEQHLSAIKQQTQQLLNDDQQQRYVAVGFLQEEALAGAYALATIIVSRAGAGSLFEIAYVQKPSIIIPLPHAAADHQRENARLYAEQSAGIVLEQENLEPNLFLDAIERVLSDEALQQSMREAAARFARPDAAQRIAEHLLSYD